MTASGFDLVVFDCDGVLVDSETIAVRVDQRVLADLGWNLALDEIVERFVGRSEAHFVATDVDNGNRPRICSCTPPERSAPHRSAAPSSKTAPTASKPRVRQGCTSSRTPAG